MERALLIAMAMSDGLIQGITFRVKCLPSIILPNQRPARESGADESGDSFVAKIGVISSTRKMPVKPPETQGMMGLLDDLGKSLARLWLGVFGFAIVLSILVCGLIASVAIGACSGKLLGGGTPGAVAFFVSAFAFGLFLSVFVWPHVKDAIHATVDRLLKSGTGV